MAIVRLQGEAERAKNIYFEVDASSTPIGEGGMGRVYKGICVDAATKVSRPVAIKFLFDGLSDHVIERARREASITIKNDSIVEMLGFIETETLVDGKPMKHYHVVSELLHGVSLSDLFEGKVADKDGNKIPFAEKMLTQFKTDSVHFAKTIVANVLTGLVALHDAGYVHRDIDPTNIMLTDDGHIKLIDFGIAKQVNRLTTNDRSLTTAGVFMGKAEYAAPELALGDTKHQNQTTDIYAMGILLYQCILGHTPFEGPVNAVLDMQIKKKVPVSKIKDKGLRHIVELATSKNQAERYQTASQMRVAIENLDGLKRKMSKGTRNRIIAACVFVAIILVCFVTFSLKKSADERVQTEMEIAAANDSLRTESAKYVSLGDFKLSAGKLHDEGYELELMDAYTNYNKAKASLQKITDGNADIKPVEQKIKHTKEELQNAQREFEQKAGEFENDGMPDIAKDFHSRSEKIKKILK